MGGRGGASGFSKSADDLRAEISKLKAENTVLFKKTLKTNKKYYDPENVEKNKAKRQRNLDRIASLEARVEKMEGGKRTGSSTMDPDAKEKFASTSTTTYEQARKRRQSNFDAWFFGSSKK